MTETQTPQPRRPSRPLRRRGGHGRPADDSIATPAPQTPLGFALAVMRDDSKPDALRVSVAKAALPYLHRSGEPPEDEDAPEREPKPEPMSDLELARRIAHILARGKDQVEREKAESLIPPREAGRAPSEAHEPHEDSLTRHGRASAARPGHPRLSSRGAQGVDGRAFAAPKRLRPRRRDEPGHDENEERGSSRPDPLDPHPGYRWI
ncbi:MAG TPA: hypothetical protein VJL90_14200 [Pseudorhodoplanes sp.]|nr:hypothetical protein [Pseudorhodoplanes sp.]